VDNAAPARREPRLAVEVPRPVLADAAVLRQVLEVRVDVELERVLAALVVGLELRGVDEVGEDGVEAGLLSARAGATTLALSRVMGSMNGEMALKKPLTNHGMLRIRPRPRRST
jgi:hypothetical protein